MCDFSLNLFEVLFSIQIYKKKITFHASFHIFTRSKFPVVPFLMCFIFNDYFIGSTTPAYQDNMALHEIFFFRFSILYLGKPFLIHNFTNYSQPINVLVRAFRNFLRLPSNFDPSQHFVYCFRSRID